MFIRGIIIALIGQLFFLVSGFAINFTLARWLGPLDYGTFGLVISILVFVELFVHTGIPEAIKKYGGENPDVINIIVKQTLKWQIIYCFLVFAVLFLASPLISRIFQDPQLAHLLRIAGIDILFYGLFKYIAGVQNGLHNFFKYSLLGMVYAGTRLCAIVGFVWVGYSLSGAFIGNIIGSLVAVTVGIAITKLPKIENDKFQFNKKSYINFVVPNIFYFVGLNLFFSLDLWFVKYYLADMNVAFYVSAALLAKLPYFLSIGLSAILLPSLGFAIASKSIKRVKEIKFETIRYLVIFLLLLIILVVTNSRLIIETLFGQQYSDAAPILAILIVGMSLITIMAVIHTILISQNLMKKCFWQIIFLLLIDITFNIILVPRFHLVGAALSTTFTGLIGAIIGGYYIFGEWKSLFFSYTPLRLAVIVGCLYLVSNSILGFMGGLSLKLLLLSLLYFILLFATKEISFVELKKLKNAIRLS